MTGIFFPSYFLGGQAVVVFYSFMHLTYAWMEVVMKMDFFDFFFVGLCFFSFRFYFLYFFLQGPLDCFIKTARAEGFLGFYKGWFAHYCRLRPPPHTHVCHASHAPLCTLN